MGFQGRGSNSVKKAVNGKARGRREQLGKEARLIAAIEHGRNDLLRDCPMERRRTTTLRLSDRDIYKPDPDQMRRWVEFGRRFAFLPPLLVCQDVVVWGEDVLEAARRLELVDLACLVADHLTPTEIGIVKIALHQQVALREIDDGMLRVILEEVEPQDLQFTFLGQSEIDVILLDDVGANKDANACPLPPEHPIVRRGDLFVLDGHRLLCGDAGDEADYRALFGGDRAIAAMTDVPYNVPIAGNVSGLGKVKHGDFVSGCGEWSDDEFAAKMVRWFSLMRDHCADGAAIGSFIDWRSLELMLRAGREAELTLINMAVWTKQGGMGAFLRSAHELYPIFCNGPQLAVNNVKLGKSGRDRTNVWNYPSATSRGSSANKALADHPTPKSVEMIEDHILDISHRGDIILDPFLGSGTTLVAADRTGRRCYGLELDPKYAQVCILRWEALTGKSAVHAESGLTFSALAQNRATQDDDTSN